MSYFENTDKKDLEFVVDALQKSLAKIEKKLKKWQGLSQIDLKKKIYAYLAGRGFDFQTIKEVLGPLAAGIKLHPFHNQQDLERKEDPIRTYTLRREKGGRIILNGANIVREFYLVEFRKK